MPAYRTRIARSPSHSSLEQGERVASAGPLFCANVFGNAMNDKPARLTISRWDFGCYDTYPPTLEITEDFIS